MDVGGTHVTAARVDVRDWVVGGSDGRSFREPLDGDGSAEEIIATLVRCASRLTVEAGTHWAVAVPGPFDYERGIGRYAGVGKFDALNGVDLGSALLTELPGAAGVSFHNDADAFLAGEWRAGAASGHARAMGITLGTGVGSSFLRDGTTVHDGPGVPPEGRVDSLLYGGRPIEEVVSRRAIRRAYARAGHAGLDLGASADPGVGAGVDPGALIDVREIAERARGGERLAAEVFAHAFRVLGTVLAPCVEAFEPTVLVVGGSIAASWDLVAGPLREGLAAHAPNPSTAATRVLQPARHPSDAPLLGAAYLAQTAGRPTLA
ncbi:ROK family protein [Catenulispora yoronensis]